MKPMETDETVKEDGQEVSNVASATEDNTVDENAFKYQEVYSIKRAISEVIDVANNRTKMIMLQVLDVCDKNIKHFGTLQTMTPSYTQYLDEVKAIYKPYVETYDGIVMFYNYNNVPTDSPENGQPRYTVEVSSKPNFETIKDMVKTQLDELDVKYASDIAVRKEMLVAFNEFLGSPAENIDFPKISIDNLPELTYKNSAIDFRALLKVVIKTN